MSQLAQLASENHAFYLAKLQIAAEHTGDCECVTCKEVLELMDEKYPLMCAECDHDLTDDELSGICTHSCPRY